MSKIKEALQKAGNEREKDYNKYFKDDGNKPDIEKLYFLKTDKVLPDVRVSYTDTKIYDINPRSLAKNKVFSQLYVDGVTDKFNLLRSQILKSLKEIEGNSILITSANPGEGKTFTSINLGICLAQEFNRTVLLVDADLRNPSSFHCDFANDFFNLKVSKGLSDYLLNQVELSDILINPGINKLTILPAGSALPNSAELFGSFRMFELVEEMKKRYFNDRIILFDTPSLLCADPVVLSRYVDAVLLVVEHEKTTAQDLQRAKELLKDSKFVGTILNKSKSDKKAYV
jgi:non-specific protein-tyrosine kinase